MTPFRLKIVTPEGIQFDGFTESVTVRTVSGELGILAGHADLVAPLGTGRCTVVTEGRRRYGACTGGILVVMDGKVTLVLTSFTWDGDVDDK